MSQHRCGSDEDVLSTLFFREVWPVCKRTGGTGGCGPYCSAPPHVRPEPGRLGTWGAQSRGHFPRCLSEARPPPGLCVPLAAHWLALHAVDALTSSGAGSTWGLESLRGEQAPAAAAHGFLRRVAAGRFGSTTRARSGTFNINVTTFPHGRTSATGKDRCRILT